MESSGHSQTATPIPLLGLGVWQVPEGAECEQGGPVGARDRIPAHRHRAGLRQRGERREGASRQRRPPRGGVHHHQVLPGTPRPGGRNREEPAPARRRPSRPVHHPLASERAHVGVAGDGGGSRTGHAVARSGSRTSASSSSSRCSRSRTRRRSINQVQFSPFEYRRSLLEACEARNVAVEAYSPLGTGRHLSDPTVARVAESRRAYARAGPASLVPSARDDRAPEVDPPRAHRAERPDLRLHAVGRRDGHARRAGPTGGTDSARERKWW